MSNCKIAATYGINELTGPTRYRVTENRGVYEFKYNAVVANWYKARPAVDHNNQVRMGWIDLTKSWSPHDWVTRQFAYFFAVSEANAFMAMQYFKYGRRGNGAKSDGTDNRTFRNALARQLFERARELRGRYASLGAVSTRFDRPDRKRKRDSWVHVSGASVHELRTYPKGVKGWCPVAKKWKQCKKQYQAVSCRTFLCSNMTRKYCVCAQELPMCVECFYGHITHRVEE